MYKKHSLTLWLLLAAITAGFSQARKIEFTEYDMPNGIHVILHKDNTTPIVAVSVLYHVGSKNEDSKPHRLCALLRTFVV
jgi:zinc protease